MEVRDVSFVTTDVLWGPRKRQGSRRIPRRGRWHGLTRPPCLRARRAPGSLRRRPLLSLGLRDRELPTCLRSTVAGPRGEVATGVRNSRFHQGRHLVSRSHPVHLRGPSVTTNLSLGLHPRPGVVPVAGEGRPRRLTRPVCSSSSPRWVPTGVPGRVQSPVKPSGWIWTPCRTKGRRYWMFPPSRESELIGPVSGPGKLRVRRGSGPSRSSSLPPTPTFTCDQGLPRPPLSTYD